MKLNVLFKDCPYDLDIQGLATNSKLVKAGDLFLCIKGVNIDRHDYIDEAIKNGAVALVTTKDVNSSVPYIKVADLNEELANIYATFYDHPEKKLKLIGITGTDGKTSTTTIIQQLIGDDLCGYIGTNGYSCSKFNRETNNTTPDVMDMYRIFNEFVNAGCKYVALEASSEAFFYGRLKSYNFVIGGLTNIDKEHLNTHKTIANYINCKKMLFKQADLAILNANDKHYTEVKADIDNYQTYGYSPANDLYIKDYEIKANGTTINLIYDNKEYLLNSPLLGSFNVENLACALLTCLNLGFNMESLIANLPQLKISGRMESINLGQDFYCLVDYAHTPNGLKRLFEFTNQLKVNKKIVVTGNAGERDASKRKYVGELCVLNNDLIIFCYEDPRNEDPLNIIADLTELVKDKDNYEVIVDRKDAIKHAINIAQKDDLVMILGKGNENYEIIKGEAIPFNDINEAKEAINNNLKKMGF